MKIKSIHLLGILLVGILTIGCYYDNEEDLFPTEDFCKTVDMSYSADIEPIMNAHCKGCHNTSSPAGGIALDNYTAVKASIPHNFLESMQHESGVSPMPQNEAKLDSCTIAKIASWIDQGALDN